MILYNKKNKDESINSFQDTLKSGTGYSVPFSDTRFMSQIEKHILPSVLNFNSKGYTTLTSCHGHGIFNFIFKSGVSISRPSITLRVNRDNVFYLKKHFNTFFIKTEISDSIDKVEKDINLRITSKLFVSLFFTNKFLCKQIETLVNKL